MEHNQNSSPIPDQSLETDELRMLKRLRGDFIDMVLDSGTPINDVETIRDYAPTLVQRINELEAKSGDVSTSAVSSDLPVVEAIGDDAPTLVQRINELEAKTGDASTPVVSSELPVDDREKLIAHLQQVPPEELERIFQQSKRQTQDNSELI